MELHRLNSVENARLAKHKTKPQHKLPMRTKGPIYPVKVVGQVTPDEVVEALRKRGIEKHRKTLLRWEKQEIIPQAKRGSYGQGGGKWADYPDHTVDEALTAELLQDVYRFKLNEIAQARIGYYNHDYNNGRALLWHDLKYIFDKGHDYASVRAAAQKHFDGFYPLLLGEQLRQWMQAHIPD